MHMPARRCDVINLLWMRQLSKAGEYLIIKRFYHQKSAPKSGNKCHILAHFIYLTRAVLYVTHRNRK